MMKNKKKDNRKRLFDLPLLARIFAFAKPYAGKFYLSIVLALLLALVSPLRPLMINLTLKKVNAADVSGAQMVLDFLLWISLLQVVLLLAETAMRFFFS
ncbi:MAG: ABC transporter ATP-binding protein, partial [bacterium]